MGGWGNGGALPGRGTSSKRMGMSCNQLETSHVGGYRNYIGSHPLQSTIYVLFGPWKFIRFTR